MEKRGQITLFVIIGLILLIGVGILIYLSNQAKLETIPTEEEYSQSYGASLEPIVGDIEFCIEKLGVEAFEQIGLHGGYIDYENYLYDNYLEYQNDAVEMFEGSGLIVPYWAYIDGSPDCRNCVARINVPALEGSSSSSIQSQVQEYIDSNMFSCTNNFSALDVKFESTLGTPKSFVLMRDNDVFIGLDWPINVTFPDGSVSSLSKFNSELDLRFRDMYELATNTLVQMELYNSERRLETFTMDVIDYLSLGGKDALIPPREGPVVTELEAPGIWRLEEVENVLKEQISENIQFMQVFKSRESFYPFTDDPYKENIFSNFQNQVVTDDAYLSRTKVRFNYFPSWPLYVGINPGAGPIIMPESTFTSMLFFQMAFTRYRFYYDVSYPVLVTLEDDVSYAGNGYTFQFAYEVNIRNNKPYSNETIFIESTLEENQDEEIGYGMYAQRTIPVKIVVVDGYSLQPIEGISLTYVCGDKSLLAGTSEIIDGSAIIDTLMPPCIGGYFELFGNDYAGKRVYRDMILDHSNEFMYEVFPEKEFTVSLSKRLFSPTITEEMQEFRAISDHKIAEDRNWILIASPNAVYSPIQDEEIMIIMNEIIDGEESERVRFAKLNYNDYQSKIKLTPGTYKLQIVSVLYMGENKSRLNIKIPERNYEVPDDFWSSMGIGAGETITIPEIELNDTMLIGSILFDNTTSGYINITIDNLLQTNKVTFFYAGFEPDELKYAQDLNVISKLNNASQIDPALFKPKFSKE